MHFINQNTESPPINSLSMALVENNLRGDVLRSTTNGEGSAFIEDLGETKISQFEVSVIGNEKVFRFEVSENDVLAMKVLEAGGDGSTVEPGLVGSEGFD